jgi:hypothetical protein
MLFFDLAKRGPIEVGTRYIPLFPDYVPNELLSVLVLNMNPGVLDT